MSNEELILFEEALGFVLSQPVEVRSEKVPLAKACGRTLAADVHSDIDMPPFDKSAVDGYAIHPADAGAHDGTSLLRVTELIPAGALPQFKLTPGHCAKIMTGAMIPPGTGRVIMVEDTEPLPGEQVRIVRFPGNTNICYRGEDIRKGDCVLKSGTRITPAGVAVLATAGAVEPRVAVLPSVGILSTGDELTEPNHIPGTGSIRNSNAPQLEAQVRSVPAHARYYGIVPDDKEMLKKTIEAALSENDVVLLTGGVSMGDFDFVPSILQDSGIQILFRKVAVQPGKPTVFGRRDGRYIFGLPGNPVSSFVIFEMMVRPFLDLMSGCTRPLPVWRLPMGTGYRRRNTGRKGFVPVAIRNGEVFPVEYHGSAHINAYAGADGILGMEIGTAEFNQGDLVHVRLL